MALNVKKILFDDTENAPLILKNDDGVTLMFEQVFAIKRKEGKFCILHPVTTGDGITDKTAVVFRVETNGKLRAVKNKDISEQIFSEYYSSF